MERAKKTAVAIIKNLPDIDLEKLELCVHVSSYLLKDEFIREVDIRLKDMKDFEAIPIDWLIHRMMSIPNEDRVVVHRLISEWRATGNTYEPADDDI